jgi:hypothetical protein
VISCVLGYLIDYIILGFDHFSNIVPEQAITAGLCIISGLTVSEEL